MRKLLSLLFISSVGFTSFSQDELADCKCGESTYKYAGELMYSYENNDRTYKYYAGIANDKVYFSLLQHEKGEIYSISIESIPLTTINFKFNDMFGSYSTTKTINNFAGVPYYRLTLGVGFYSAKTAERTKTGI